jgi:hypothetical protein
VGIERRIQVAHDGGKIDAIVFGAGMVSGDQQTASGENR